MEPLTYNLSFWEREIFFKNIDALVVGSGIVGLSAAIELKRAHPEWRVVILERGPHPLGASTRNAGFACFGSLTELLDDVNLMGVDNMLAIVERRWKGLLNLRALLGDAAMEYQGLGGYEMFTEDEEAVFATCREQIDWFNTQIGAITGFENPYAIVDERIPAFGFESIRHLVINRPEGQVHTGRMMAAMLSMAQKLGVETLNGVSVEHIDDRSTRVEVTTDFGWTVTARKVLIAVNGFAKRLLPELDVYPARNQVLITKPIAGLKIKGCFHYDRGYFYFRNIGDRILLGGGRNLAFDAEKTDRFGANELIRSALVQLLHRVIAPGQQAEVDSWWTGIMGLGPVKKPIVEKMSENVVVAVRMSGMGVAIGSLVGKEGADLCN